ncbi:hypothetical protein VCUG_01999 [Vavraia culicis subsp. floridensis]|uniref:Uncharacterized protein n=1 Tax=Vavraia culicis (isolate floridensis) TaxID=948595 RepID=L2GT16_VAVCU|nr:uncharacterized protein VCUG_01999 [Vavraia culicis subsp. floridensis]ELA46507.1 hypothetical protein VCUG_01999 [Vavraia culicis subsp. floridensis]
MENENTLFMDNNSAQIGRHLLSYEADENIAIAVSTERHSEFKYHYVRMVKGLKNFYNLVNDHGIYHSEVWKSTLEENKVLVIVLIIVVILLIILIVIAHKIDKPYFIYDDTIYYATGNNIRSRPVDDGIRNRVALIGHINSYELNPDELTQECMRTRSGRKALEYTPSCKRVMENFDEPCYEEMMLKIRNRSDYKAEIFEKILVLNDKEHLIRPFDLPSNFEQNQSDGSYYDDRAKSSSGLTNMRHTENNMSHAISTSIYPRSIYEAGTTPSTSLASYSTSNVKSHDRRNKQWRGNEVESIPMRTMKISMPGPANNDDDDTSTFTSVSQQGNRGMSHLRSKLSKHFSSHWLPVTNNEHSSQRPMNGCPSNRGRDSPITNTSSNLAGHSRQGLAKSLHTQQPFLKQTKDNLMMKFLGTLPDKPIRVPENNDEESSIFTNSSNSNRKNPKSQRSYC